MTRVEAKARQLELTAYHEAGHAVAAFALGQAFRYVTIIPDEAEGTDGHVAVFNRRVPPNLDDLSPRRRVMFERDIVVYLAGGIAEMMKRGRYSHVGAGRDYQNIVQIIFVLVGDEEEANAYLKWLHIQTRNLLRNPVHWYAVECLAAELLQKRKINAKDAKDIIRAAGRNVPEQRWVEFRESLERK